MTNVYPHLWERPLLSLATEGVRGLVAQAHHPVADQALLDRAYARCAALTSSSSRTFYRASGLLPAQKRRAIRALYAFCRVSDDIVDRPAGHAQDALVPGHAQEAFAAWRRAALAPQPAPENLVAIAWADTRYQYGIPICYVRQLLDGVARDVQQTRYATFADLAAYAYGVASTVGLMSMHIIGYTGPEAVPFAVKLGVALQLTNILRDVGEDWQQGRLYLPQDELASYGLTETDVALGRVGERWRTFMRFQIERTRGLYAEAWPGIALLDKDGRLAIAAAGTFYRAILDDIEAHDYDVFRRRAHVGTLNKLRRLPGLWWSTR